MATRRQTGQVRNIWREDSFETHTMPSSKQTSAANTTPQRRTPHNNTASTKRTAAYNVASTRRTISRNASHSGKTNLNNASSSNHRTPDSPSTSGRIPSKKAPSLKKSIPHNASFSGQNTPHRASPSRQITPCPTSPSRQLAPHNTSPSRQSSLFSSPFSEHDSRSKKRRDVGYREKKELATWSPLRKWRKLEQRLTPFEKALLQEGLYIPGCVEATAPVLKICYEMEDFELAIRKNVFASSFFGVPRPHEYDWESSLLEPHVIKIVSSLYEGEPILDGLPASMWLSCMEPALPMLVTLNTMKRRRTNLALCQRGLQMVDSDGDLHGDMNVPVGPDHRPPRMPEEAYYSMGESDVPIIETIKYHRLIPNRPRNERHYIRPHRCALIDW